MRAARYGYTEVLKELIAAGADIDVQDNDSRTALIWATQEGHTAVEILLREAGATE